jgi:hypothetical protein
MQKEIHFQTFIYSKVSYSNKLSLRGVNLKLLQFYNPNTRLQPFFDKWVSQHIKEICIQLTITCLN